MHVGRKTQKREKSAMSVSLYGNLLFVVIELVMAILTGSQAVLLDAVYDGVEFVMLLPSLFLIPFLYRPSSEQHPFGYTQIETLFIVIKGITMTQRNRLYSYDFRLWLYSPGNYGIKGTGKQA